MYVGVLIYCPTLFFTFWFSWRFFFILIFTRRYGPLHGPITSRPYIYSSSLYFLYIYYTMWQIYIQRNNYWLFRINGYSYVTFRRRQRRKKRKKLRKEQACSRCNSTNRKNQPIQQNRSNFWTSNAIWMPSNALKNCNIVYFMTKSTVLNR